VHTGTSANVRTVLWHRCSSTPDSDSPRRGTVPIGHGGSKVFDPLMVEIVPRNGVVFRP
jgi:hypothetical protein